MNESKDFHITTTTDADGTIHFPTHDDNVVQVISGFPGIGKSWLYNNQDDLGLKVNDSDSSQFSWLEDGVTRNPDFPNNYIKHIKDQMTKSDVVLVSSHDVVRDALKDAGIKFITVFPHVDDKEEYIKRFIERGSKETFVKLIEANWNNWLANINNNDDGLHVELNLGEYLSGFILGSHNKDSKLSFSIKGTF